MIWGGYAKGNTGDELCLAAALERKLREFDGSVVVLSSHPEYTSQLFPEASVLPYLEPDRRSARPWNRFFRACKSLATASGRAYLKQYRRLDPGSPWARYLSGVSQLYLAGGGYITDLFPLDFTLAPIQLALDLKIPIATAPLGIGPFKSSLWADTVAVALRQMKLTVRDQASLDFCRARDIAAALEPDDAFALVRNLSLSVSSPLPGPRPRKIGVCIFTQYGQDADCDLSEWWIECLRRLQAEHPGYEIEGFCFHTSLSAEFQEMTRLFPRAGLPAGRVLSPVADFHRAVQIIRSYDFVITTRFHAAVVANVFNIPNIAIAAGDYYQAKMTAAVHGCENFSHLINPARQSPETVLAICRRELMDK
jgi:polysaccharide pyruvyl transferase WcaK-like protein